VRILPILFLILPTAGSDITVARHPIKTSTSLTHDSSPRADETLDGFVATVQKVVDETIASKKGDKIEAQLQAMQIPDFQTWYLATFGPVTGAKLANIYSETLLQTESHLEEQLVSTAEPGGQVTASKASGGSDFSGTPHAQKTDTTIRKSLTQPAIFYYLEYQGKSPRTGAPYSVRFGYAVLVSGTYRVVPENVLRALPGMPSLRLRQGAAVTSASLVTKVPPVYPVEALKQHVSGTVRLHAVIDVDGSIQSLEVISGNPLLTQAALDAVRKWRYRRALRNGEPVEVDTAIEVDFSFGK